MKKVIIVLIFMFMLVSSVFADITTVDIIQDVSYYHLYDTDLVKDDDGIIRASYYYDIIGGKYIQFHNSIYVKSVYFRPFVDYWNISFKFIKDGEVVLDIIHNNNFNVDMFVDRIEIYGRTDAYGKATSLSIMCDVEALGNPVLTTIPNVNSIYCYWGKVEGAEGYKIYKNNQFVAETNETKYKLTGLTSNTTYNVTVEAFGGDYVSGITTKSVTTLNYWTLKPNTGINVSYDWAKISWNRIEEAKGYQIEFENNYIDLNEYVSVYTLKNLKLGTPYKVKIRTLFEDGYSDWTEIEFVTLSEIESPPNAPEKIEVVEVTTDLIKLKVSEVMFANSYNWYIDNKFHGNSDTLYYQFDGLNPSTSYAIQCKAVNMYGESTFGKVILVRTKEKEYPIVKSVTNTYVPKNDGSGGGGSTVSPRYQKISWDAHNTNQVKVILDGKEIGIFNRDDVAYIDFDELELEGDIHELEVQPYPLTSDSKGYKIKIMSKGTGDADFDKVISEINDANNTIKKAGLYLLLGILSVLILFFCGVWLFNKWKLTLVTKNPEQLEADPDLAMLNDMTKKNELDKETYKIADKTEDNYFRKKKEFKENSDIKYKRNEQLKKEDLSNILKELDKINIKVSNKKPAKAGTIQRLKQLKRKHTFFGFTNEKAILNEYNNELVSYRKRQEFNKRLRNYNDSLLKNALDKLEKKNKK